MLELIHIVRAFDVGFTFEICRESRLTRVTAVTDL